MTFLFRGFISLKVALKRIVQINHELIILLKQKSINYLNKLPSLFLRSFNCTGVCVFLYPSFSLEKDISGKKIV